MVARDGGIDLAGRVPLEQRRRHLIHGTKDVLPSLLRRRRRAVPQRAKARGLGHELGGRAQHTDGARLPAARGTGTSHATAQRASRGASRGASREQGSRLPARTQRRDQSNAVAQLGRLGRLGRLSRLALAAPGALSCGSTAGRPRVLLERVRRRRGWRAHRGHRARLCDGPGAEATPRDDDARLGAWTRAGG